MSDDNRLILEDAAERVRRGWTRGVLRTDEGEVCLVGALGMAMELLTDLIWNDEQQIWQATPYEVRYALSWSIADWKCGRSDVAIPSFWWPWNYEAYRTSDAVTGFNDRDDVTQDDVIDVLLSAAKRIANDEIPPEQ